MTPDELWRIANTLRQDPEFIKAWNMRVEAERNYHKMERDKLIDDLINRIGRVLYERSKK